VQQNDKRLAVAVSEIFFFFFFFSELRFISLHVYDGCMTNFAMTG
jgi:hypothetical protein